MKILICGDLHYSEFSSIIRKKKVRLQNCINTLNWVEATADKYKCDEIIYLGDFFDKPELNAEELTYLQYVTWSTIPHVVLVGNHEMEDVELNSSSTHILNCLPNFMVIDKPLIRDNVGKNPFLYLPYITEDKREKLSYYIGDNLPPIVFSHNDIKGIQMGQFISKEGFDIEDIKNNCRLFVNGHLHNGVEMLEDHIINIGNVTGQNFSEDAFKYEHHIMIMDTDCDTFEMVENPFAFNFYKIEFNNKSDMEGIANSLKPNSVISAKSPQEIFPKIQEFLENLTMIGKVTEYRLLKEISLNVEEEDKLASLTSIDHIEEFKRYILGRLDNSDILLEELQHLA